MGYRDSDVFLFYAFIIISVVIFILRRDRSAPPENKPESGPVSRTAPPKQEEKRSLPDAGLQTFVGGVPEIKGIFVAVTVWDQEVQMMAMSLATQVLGKGKKVRILACGPGGDLVNQGTEEKMFKPLDKSPKMLLKNLIQNGVTVEVCPFYLANSDNTEADLVEGVTVANPSVIADILLEPGIKLFTF